MDKVIRDVYIFMIILKDENRLDAVGVYEAIKHDEWWKFTDRDRCTKFICEHFNNNQDGFNFYFEY